MSIVLEQNLSRGHITMLSFGPKVKPGYRRLALLAVLFTGLPCVAQALANFQGNDFEPLSPHSVWDKSTALVWQAQDDGVQRTWPEAEHYCQALSLDGARWRLPTRLELFSLVDYQQSNPAIESAYFPKTQSFNYWTSTPYFGVPQHAWSISFNEGAVYCFLRELGNYVRCVRPYES